MFFFLRGTLFFNAVAERDRKREIEGETERKKERKSE
jgi:hypothetical protein